MLSECGTWGGVEWAHSPGSFHLHAYFIGSSKKQLMKSHARTCVRERGRDCFSSCLCSLGVNGEAGEMAGVDRKLLL